MVCRSRVMAGRRIPQRVSASEDFEFVPDLMEDYTWQINDIYVYALSGSRWLAEPSHIHILRNRMLLRLHDCGQKIECFRL